MANRTPAKRIWQPVIDRTADSFWLLLIVALSLTVLVTRVFLTLAGYPQIGDSTYHIAHVLWGGLLLFIAVTLLLSLVNRYARWCAAVLGGIGGGLFIDEVGKFITQSNDYFFPLAFPLIYSFILICVWLFYRLRRRKPRAIRTLLYHALEDMKEVLDNDLDPFEYRALITELQQVVAEAQDPSQRQLAEALLAYVQSRDVQRAIQPNPLDRLLDGLRHTLAGWPPQRILKAILLLGFGFLAVEAAVTLLQLLAAYQAGSFRAAFSTYVVVSGKAHYTVSQPTLLLVTTLAVIGVGSLALVAALLLALGHDRRGVRLGSLALVIALSFVNLFTVYFNQLAAVLEALMQVLLLGVASLYRWRFLPLQPPTPGVLSSEKSVSEQGRYTA
jgi:hypothetical protein